MKVARVRTTRRSGVSGLECLRCGELFRKASEFVKHPCWALMMAEAAVFNLKSRLEKVAAQPANFETLTGEQLELEL